MQKYTKPRVRSDAQLARKRSVDRIRNQAKRARTKNQLDGIEEDMAQIRESMQGLVEEVHALQASLREIKTASNSPEIPLSIGNGIYQNAPGMSNGADDTGQQAAMQIRCHHGNACPVRQSSIALDYTAEPSFDTDSNPTWPHAGYVPVVCRCGVKHETECECLELSTFTMLLHSHQNLSNDSSRVKDLPRNASMANMLLLSDEGNPIAVLLNSVFKSAPSMKLPTMVASYFLMYRYLRWRAYPDAESFEEIPDWVRPTAAQTSIPHPVCIDYNPWPALRDHLVRHTGQDARHTVNLYITHVRFRWPESKTFLWKNEDSEVVLSPEFISAACEYDNWRISREWAQMFPDLAPYVNVEDENT